MPHDAGGVSAGFEVGRGCAGKSVPRRVNAFPGLGVWSTRGMNSESVSADLYRAGVCNIGPDEIAHRRLSGHVGAVTTLGLAGVLIAARAPAPIRLLTALPAAVSSAGYIQARTRFCAAYGQLGVFNFGRAGEPHQVIDPTAAAADRRRARQIGLASGTIGLAIGIAAMLIPLGR